MTMPYALKLANLGWSEATKRDPALSLGVNILRNTIVHPGVAKAFGDLPSAHLDQVLAQDKSKSSSVHASL